MDNFVGAKNEGGQRGEGGGGGGGGAAGAPGGGRSTSGDGSALRPASARGSVMGSSEHGKRSSMRAVATPTSPVSMPSPTHV